MNFKELASASMKAAKARRALDIREEQVDSITVLHFSGDLDIKTLPKARTAIDGLLGEPAKKGGKGKAKGKAEGPLNVVVDLEDVEYIDSSGLGFFIGTLKKLKERKGNLKLANLNAYMMGIFKLINMHYILEIHEDLDKALKSFSPRRGAAARANKE